MVRGVLFGVCLVAGTYATGALSAEIIFTGSYVTTDAQNCVKPLRGEDYHSDFYPRIAGVNQNFTSLNFANPDSATVYQLSGGDFTSAFKNVKSSGTFEKEIVWTGAQVRITYQAPASITSATRFVSLRGQIKKPKFDPGMNGQPCIITFEAAYRRQS